MTSTITKEELETRSSINKANDEFFKNYTKLNNIENHESKIKFIKETISEGNYPQNLKPFIKILYNYADTKDLYRLAINLSNVKLKRINPFKWLISDGSYGTYDPLNNIITYFNKNSIPHELLHLASTKDTNISGFNFIKTGHNIGRGLNEGYTEMLSQRIFFQNNYTKSAYKTDVYLLRLFELLYDNPKEMEIAYLNANYESPIKQFLKYGTINEYKHLSKNLDYFATTDIWDNEEDSVFEFLINKVEKTKEKQKIKKANNIYDEYISTNKKFL